MGHIRLGRIPKVRGWTEVIATLDDRESTTADIAAATARAAKDFFAQNKTDPGLVFSYWFLTQITYRARSHDFVAQMQATGLDIGNVASALDFLARIAAFTRREIGLRGGVFPLSDIAQLSLREVITETIGQRSRTLFGTTLEDIRLACRTYSTPGRFSQLARLFFSKVLNRTLQFFVSKESPNTIGVGRKFQDTSALSDFNRDLEAYCHQSAAIVEEFAGGWYSKRNWRGDISENDARGFVAVAMEKLRDEIAREDRPAEGAR